MADGVGVASKTYRRTVIRIAETLRVEPRHTDRPSEDLETMLEVMDEEARKRALRMYERGLRRGYDKATTDVAEGKLQFTKGQLTCPSDVVISAKIKFRGRSRREKIDFKFTPEELGFE
jgi:hypothetical protein